MSDLISRRTVIDMVEGWNLNQHIMNEEDALDDVKALPSAEPQIIHCKDCKHWKQQTNYAGSSLSFGFCESDEMWRSLYGETYEVSHIVTDDDFYCGYAERKIDE